MNGDKWRELAACLGMDPTLFFPARGQSCDIARDVCARCPVRVECLEYALELKLDEGVFGGESGRERKRIRRQRRAEAGTARHGTRACYAAGCTLPECRAAETEYQRDRRGFHERRSLTHGTRSCYVTGCREPECVEAQREYDRERRRRGAA